MMSASGTDLTVCGRAFARFQGGRAEGRGRAPALDAHPGHWRRREVLACTPVAPGSLTEDMPNQEVDLIGSPLAIHGVLPRTVRKRSPARVVSRLRIDNA